MSKKTGSNQSTNKNIQFTIKFDNGQVTVTEGAENIIINPFSVVEIAYSILSDMYKNYFKSYKSIIKDEEDRKQLGDYINQLVLTGTIARFLLYFEPLMEEWGIDKVAFFDRVAKTNYLKVSQEFLEFLNDKLGIQEKNESDTNSKSEKNIEKSDTKE